MMLLHPKKIKINPKFVNRAFEAEKLKKAASLHEACIIIMFGRRRVGKTELLEQTFRDRNLLKFEGIEGLSQTEQFAHIMQQFSEYAKEPLFAKTVINTWTDFFKLLAKHTQTGTWTLYLEELQWLANYQNTLVSELKYVWDNHFRHNPNLVIILCGSAPSFMLEQVIHSKALYNRSQYEFHLKEFNLIEAQLFLKKRSSQETLDAYLTVGGIPEYLKWLNKESSVYLSLCHHSFTAGSFFSREYGKIFTSNMAKNKHYQQIIEILSKHKFSTREELIKLLKLQSGGGISSVLLDLEKSGFIEKNVPFYLNDNAKTARYTISDNYLHFYNKFIKPIHKKIEGGAYDLNPVLALNKDSYVKWLGLAFERFCRKNHGFIAKILGFAGVQYKFGVFFSRATEKTDPGFQIDLIFERADKVYTICEIKYTQHKITPKIIEEFEKKLALFPNKENKSIQKVLICNEGADTALSNRLYFDHIITRSDLLNSAFW